MPHWYMTIRAARYLGVPPWELEAQPIMWRNRALLAQSAEVWVENEQIKRGRQK